MKKNTLNKNGFAMLELLAVTVSILLIFSLLFSNYLPLVASYENRIIYNNVTAEYSAFYVRKIYKDVLENRQDVLEFIERTVENEGYYTVFSKNKDLENNDYQNKLKNIINEYNIEEIIITKYDISDLKQKYQKNSGSLYNYINYLSVTSAEEELYRIVLKTKDYGYATTEIFVLEKTPIECFSLVMSSDGKGFEIENYDNKKEGCTSKISILNSNYEVNGVSAKIIGIKEKAFENKGITSIKLAKSITKIEPYAFADNKIEKLVFNIDAPGVVSVGEGAFKNNNLKEIIIPKNIDFGKDSFASNIFNKITLENGLTKVPEGMFKLNSSKDDEIYLNITIPKEIKEIGKDAFKNQKITNISFENNSILETIGESSFSIENKDISFLNNDIYYDLNFPKTVKSIGQSAFLNAKIKSVDLTDLSITEINKNTFRADYNKKINNIEIEVPKTVTKIDTSAFNGFGLEKVEFEKNVNLLSIEDLAFANNNLIEFNFPGSLNKVGSKIFGNNFLMGKQVGEITADYNQNKILDNEYMDFCKILYGSSCNEEKKSDSIYKYSFEGRFRYISYVGEGGSINE